LSEPRVDSVNDKRSHLPWYHEPISTPFQQKDRPANMPKPTTSVGTKSMITPQ
jgi:hypothetical protein